MEERSSERTRCRTASCDHESEVERQKKEKDVESSEVPDLDEYKNIYCKGWRSQQRGGEACAANMEIQAGLAVRIQVKQRGLENIFIIKSIQLKQVHTERIFLLF